MRSGCRNRPSDSRKDGTHQSTIETIEVNMKKDIYTVKITEQQKALLLDCLSDHCDCGPTGEGWKSDELSDLIKSIEKQTEYQSTIG